MEISKLIEEITREVIKEMSDSGQLNTDRAGIPDQGGGTGTELENLAWAVDHTLLKPETSYKDIERICNEAREYKFASVCVNPTNVRFAAKILKNSEVKVCTVIGFPLGANTPVVKAMETRDAIANGAREVDMVINIGAVKSGDYDLVLRDIKAVVDAAAGQALVKVIIETSALSDREKVKVCLLAKEAGAQFVKTSTGFGQGGATVEDITLMKETVGPGMEVKASTGIRDRETALRLIKAGATRLGTSAGIAIVKGGRSESNY